MHIGIVGASGLVGKKIIESLHKISKYFDSTIDEITLYGSDNYTEIIFIFGKQHTIKKFYLCEMLKLNYCILAVDNPVARSIIDYTIEKNLNCVIIDNSSEFRLYKNVPLIIPEINMDDYKEQKLISNPNCSTTILLMALYPLSKLSKIKRVVLSTYQAASGSGVRGLEELLLQTTEYAENKKLTTQFWGKQYIHNVFSHNSEIDVVTLYNKEELKIINESKKILHDNSIIIDPTCIRVPVLQSHSISVNIEFEEYQIIENITHVLEEFEGIKIVNNFEKNEFPEPAKSSNCTDVFVGRIRHCPENSKIWNLFVTGDQLLKGAGYNSVQILEKILERNLSIK